VTESILYQGDCLVEMGKIADGSIDLVLADVPYGTTQCKWDNVIPFEPMWEQLKRLAKKRAAIVLFGSEPFSSALRMSNIKDYKYDWVWVKEQGTGFLNSKKQPLKNNEQVSVFYKKQPLYSPQMRLGFEPYICKQGKTKTKNYGTQTGATTKSNGERYPLNTLYFNRDSNKLHPTQKPVALMEYLIKTYTNEGDTVLDFTAGSFTTAIACIRTNRKFIGIEKDDKYFEIGKNRVIEELRQTPLLSYGKTDTSKQGFLAYSLPSQIQNYDMVLCDEQE